MGNDPPDVLTDAGIDKLRRDVHCRHVQAIAEAERTLKGMRNIFLNVWEELRYYGYSQAKIGRLVKRSQTRVSLWVTGQNPVPAQTLVKILPILLDELQLLREQQNTEKDEADAGFSADIVR